MFVRIKRIKGQDYGYLVGSVWTNKGPRQKVTKYLGKIIRGVPTKSETLEEFVKKPAEQFVQEKEYADIVKQLVALTLHHHDLVDTDIDFAQHTVKRKGRNCVLAMNEGFLCGETLRQLFSYNSDDDYSGFVLADRITATGIKIEKDVFIALFGKLQKKVEQQKAEEMDFYY